MVFEFSIDSDGAATHLRGVAARAANMKPILAAVLELLREGFRDNWASRGADFGGAWAPNRPGTLANKARRGQEGLLHATGALEQAVGGGRGATRSVRLTSVRAGVSGRSLYYARFIQAGRSGGKRGGAMAARPIVGIDTATTVESVGMMERFLVGGTR